MTTASKLGVGHGKLRRGAVRHPDRHRSGRGRLHRAAAQGRLGLNGHHLPHASRMMREVQAGTRPGLQHPPGQPGKQLAPELAAAALLQPCTAPVKVTGEQRVPHHTSAASSVHFTGTGTDSGQNLSLALTVVRGKGCTGTISESKSGSFRVVYLGKSVWIKPDAAFWKSIAAGGSDARLGASLLSGKWLKDSAGDTSGLGALVSLCSLNSLFSQATLASDQLVKGTLTALNGQAVLPIKDVTHRGTAYVTDTANPELLSLTSTGSSSGTFSFSGFGTPATITPPPASEVVDGSKYGF